VNLLEAQKYIEVGGGPENLPSRYHTVIELPAGTLTVGVLWKHSFELFNLRFKKIK
jgi:hypothetical protein